MKSVIMIKILVSYRGGGSLLLTVIILTLECASESSGELVKIDGWGAPRIKRVMYLKRT